MRIEDLKEKVVYYSTIVLLLTITVGIATILTNLTYPFISDIAYSSPLFSTSSCDCCYGECSCFDLYPLVFMVYVVMVGYIIATLMGMVDSYRRDEE
jgi:hypothetical protein